MGVRQLAAPLNAANAATRSFVPKAASPDTTASSAAISPLHRTRRSHYTPVRPPLLESPKEAAKRIPGSLDKTSPDAVRPVEVDQHNLRVRADSHGWSPCSRPGRRVDHHFAERAQPIGVGAENPLDDPPRREQLPSMRVPGKLQRDSGLLRHRKTMRRVAHQNAGATSVQLHSVQDQLEPSRAGRSVVIHAHDLHPVDNHFPVVQDANARVFGGFQGSAACKLLMISRNQISSEGRTQLGPGLRQAFRISASPVVEIAADENDIRRERRGHLDNPAAEANPAYVPQVQIADEGGRTSAPRFGQIRQIHVHSADADARPVEYSVESDEKSQTEQRRHDHRPARTPSAKPRNPIKNPGKRRRATEKVQESKPGSRKAVKHPTNQLDDRNARIEAVTKLTDS